jgi:uncharacterized membrane protein HdeD (DUF308 family)
MNKEEKQYYTILENYSKKTKQYTLNDASSVTGVSLFETENAVKSLLENYDCRLKVTETGDLIYDFGNYLKPRNQKTFLNYFNEFLGLLWKGFTVFYKFMISAFLVIYFIIFLIILVGIVVAAMSGGKDNDNKGIGNFFYLVLRIFISIFEWNTIMGYNNTYRRTDRYGYSYKHYTEKKGVLADLSGSKADSQSNKAFVASIYDFVFGPPRFKNNPLENMQEVATFLKENRGLICTSEIQALAGWRRGDAENFMTEVLSNFNGKAEVSDKAILYGNFSDLLRRKDNVKGAPVIYYWDEYEPEHELTGNKPERNAGIVAMNVFNLIFSLLILFGPLKALTIEFPVLEYLLGWLPLVYSVLFFLIPAVRWVTLIPKKRQQHITNIRKRIMKAIFQEQSAVITLKRLTEIANSNSKEEKLSENTVEDIMMEVIYDLKGDSSVDNNGEMVYKFDELDLELEEIERLRNGIRDDSSLGKIVFES